jgi:glycerol-3-phosphate dehydrogenase
MGLPKSKLTATRKQVESGKLEFKDSVEYKMYSRHDAPDDEMKSDSLLSPILNAAKPFNK